MKKMIVILFLTIMLTGCISIKNNVQTELIPKENQTDILINKNFLFPEIAVWNDVGTYMIVPDYVIGAYNVKYYDSKSNIVTYLCSNISCTHSGSNCTSYISSGIGGSELILLNNNLYVFSKGNTVNTPPFICSVSLTGDSYEKIIELDTTQRIISPFIYGQNSIYFVVEEATKDSGGKVELNYYLSGINLGLKQFFKIASLPENSFLRGCIDNKFVVKTISDNTHYIYLVGQNGIIYDSFYSYPQGESYEFEANNKLFLLNYSDKALHQVQTDGTIKTISSLPFDGSPSSTFLRIVDDEILILDNTVFEPSIQDVVTSRYFIDLDNGEYKELSIKTTISDRESPINVISYTNEYVFAIYDYKKDTYSFTDKDGLIYNLDISSPAYCRINTNDYINNKFIYEPTSTIG